jgi:hypothetical protein
MAGEALEGAKPDSQRSSRSHEQMNVVWHHYEGMQIVAMKAVFSVIDSIHHHVSDLGLAKVERPGARIVE